MAAAALAHLYEQHRSAVLGALARRCPWVTPADRESLYHDAYTAVLERERVGSLEPERMHPRELRAYLVKSSIHKALDERQSAERRRTVPLDLASHDRADGGLPLDEAAIRTLDAATVRELVGELPARGQAVLRLRFLHELEPGEIESLLRISRRVYRKELERAVRQIASRYELVRDGRWHETRRSLVLAYVAGVSGPRRAGMARAHLAACPSCAALAVELRRAAERVAAVVPLPALALDYGPLQRTIEAAVGAKSSLTELGSGAKQQLGSLAHRVSDPTPLAAARPGAVAAAVGGCLVLGGGATYCAVEGLPDAIRSPLGIEERAQPSPASGKRDQPPAQPLNQAAAATPDPVPLGGRRLALATAASAGTLRATDREAGIRFALDGRALTVRLLASAPSRTRLKVRGERIDASCGVAFGPVGRGEDPHARVQRTRLWPAGRARLRYRFHAETSRPARWCRLQHPTAVPAHVAFVLFPRSESAATLSQQQRIEQTANKWAALFAAAPNPDACAGWDELHPNREVAVKYMGQPACERATCERVGHRPIENCTPLTPGFQRSFANATVQDVAIKGRHRAAARFSNGEAVELLGVPRVGADTRNPAERVWMIDKIGGNAGRGYFE